MLPGHRDLRALQKAFEPATQIFRESNGFPKEQRHAPTDQIRPSSRSVAAYIAVAFRKRRYPVMFVDKPPDAGLKRPKTQCGRTPPTTAPSKFELR